MTSRAWVNRSSMLFRTSAGMMFIISMGAFAAATLLAGLRCPTQILVGGGGIVYSIYLKNLSEELATSNMNRAFIPAIINIMGFPSMVVFFFPLFMPEAKIVGAVTLIVLGIATLVCLIKAKTAESSMAAARGDSNPIIKNSRAKNQIENQPAAAMNYFNNMVLQPVTADTKPVRVKNPNAKNLNDW